MNASNPAVPPPGFISTPESYKDRSTGLMVFGILTVLLGCLCLLFVILMVVGQSAASAMGQEPARLAAILPAILMYGLLAVALVWLGIGSIMARRWARTLMVIFSWSWLAMGVFIMVSMSIVMYALMPQMLANIQATQGAGHPAPSAGALGVIMAVAFIIDGFLFIILPSIWTYFYSNRHVKATCEARDPVPGWTDRCPLPVLGLSLWMAFTAFIFLFMPLAGRGVAPFFGMFLTGIGGSIFYVALAAVWAYAAGLVYQLDLRGWWLVFIVMLLFVVSTVLTYAQHDVIEMYRLMGYPEKEIAQIQQSGLVTGRSMTWITLGSSLPFFGYLFFVKRYFRRKV